MAAHASVRCHRSGISRSCGARCVDAFVEAESADDGAQPGDVRRRGRRRARHRTVRHRRRPRPRRSAVRRSDRGVAVADRAVRQLRRGDGRGTRQGPGGQSAPRQDRHPRQSHRLRQRRRTGAGDAAAARRRRAGVGRRSHSRRRRDHRGRRLRRRVGDHRRIRAGDSRGRRRSVGRDRRHARALGLDQGADHGQSRRDVPRSHDRARRGRRAAEDAERDRAQHPAGRPDDHLPGGGRDAAAAGGLFRRAADACSCWCRCSSA